MWDPDDDAHGDDPAYGLVPTSDEAWDAALGVLATDEEFLRRRAALDPLALHVVVRDVDELELSAWPDPDAAESVVLTVPAAIVLAEESRVEAYLDAVVTLMTAGPGRPRRAPSSLPDRARGKCLTTARSPSTAGPPRECPKARSAATDESRGALDPVH